MPTRPAICLKIKVASKCQEIILKPVKSVKQLLPLPILGTGWVNSFMLVCELTTWREAVDTSYRDVARKCTTWFVNSSGGWTPTPTHAILNSLKYTATNVKSFLFLGHLILWVRQFKNVRSKRSISNVTLFFQKLKIYEYKCPWSCPSLSNHEILCTWN